MWLADGRILEVQIRTDEMHERAVSGSAAHQDYRATQMGAIGAGQRLAKRTGLALRGVQAATELPSTSNVLPAATGPLPFTEARCEEVDAEARHEEVDVAVVPPIIVGSPTVTMGDSMGDERG